MDQARDNADGTGFLVARITARVGAAPTVGVHHCPQLDAATNMYYKFSVRFEWDPLKAEANLRKHGVSFEEAQTVFDDPLVLVEADWAQGEQRDIAIGTSSHGRLLFTVSVELDQNVIRIISARRAGPHERRRYEEGD